MMGHVRAAGVQEQKLSKGKLLGRERQHRANKKSKLVSSLKKIEWKHKSEGRTAILRETERGRRRRLEREGWRERRRRGEDRERSSGKEKGEIPSLFSSLQVPKG